VTIRNINQLDLEKLKEIHHSFFEHEFTFEDFLHGSISSFVITDDNDGEIITAGSIRPIAEMTAISNLAKSPRLRRNALFDMLQISQYVLHNTSYDQLHVFVQNGKWEEMLKRAGFKQCAGRPLFIDIRGNNG
jgi:citrate lyase synthetase